MQRSGQKLTTDSYSEEGTEGTHLTRSRERSPEAWSGGEVEKVRLPPPGALGPKRSSRKSFPSDEQFSTTEWALGEIVSSPTLEASKSLGEILGFSASPRSLGCPQRDRK